MVDPLSAMNLALQAFASARDILKSLGELKVDAQVQAKVIELQNSILAAQAAAMQMQQELAEERERVGRLQATLNAHDEWAATMKRYTLVDAGLGKMLYEFCGEGQRHYVCPNCVNERVASILRTGGRESESLWCPKCKTTFQIKHLRPLRVGRVGPP